MSWWSRTCEELGIVTSGPYITSSSLLRCLYAPSSWSNDDGHGTKAFTTCTTCFVFQNFLLNDTKGVVRQHDSQIPIASPRPKASRGNSSPMECHWILASLEVFGLVVQMGFLLTYYWLSCKSMIYENHRAADGSIKQLPANLRAHEFLLLLLLLLLITNLSPLSVLSPLFSYLLLLLLLLKRCCSLFSSLQPTTTKALLLSLLLSSTYYYYYYYYYYY